MTAAKRFKLTAPAAREHAEQSALFRWAEVAGRADPRLQLLYAVPNGLAASSTGEAARAKKAGLRSGVPDACLPVPSGGYHGLYVELKRRDGVPSDVTANQKIWLARLADQGYRALVAYGWDQARTEILAYLAESRPESPASDAEPAGLSDSATGEKIAPGASCAVLEASANEVFGTIPGTTKNPPKRVPRAARANGRLVTKLTEITT